MYIITAKISSQQKSIVYIITANNQLIYALHRCHSQQYRTINTLLHRKMCEYIITTANEVILTTHLNISWSPTLKVRVTLIPRPPPPPLVVLLLLLSRPKDDATYMLSKVNQFRMCRYLSLEVIKMSISNPYHCYCYYNRFYCSYDCLLHYYHLVAVFFVAP